MKCTNCGMELGQNDMFCPNCGQAVQRDTTENWNNNTNSGSDSYQQNSNMNENANTNSNEVQSLNQNQNNFTYERNGNQQFGYNYQQNSGYTTNNNYGQNNGYTANNNYGQNNNYMQNGNYTSNSYGQNNSYMANSNYGTNNNYTQNSNYSSNNYGQGNGYTAINNYTQGNNYATNNGNKTSGGFINKIKEDKAILAAVIGIGAVLVIGIILIIVGIAVSVSNGKEKDNNSYNYSSSSNSGTSSSNSNSSSGSSSNSSYSSNSSSSSSSTGAFDRVNVSGYSFDIPDEILYSLSDGALLLIDSMQSWMASVEITTGSFQQAKSKISALENAAIEEFGSGTKIIKSGTEKVDGTECIILEYSVSGVYRMTGALEINSTRVLIFDVYFDEEIDRDALRTIVKIAKTANYTGKSDYIQIDDDVKFLDISKIYQEIMED